MLLFYMFRRSQSCMSVCLACNVNTFTSVCPLLSLCLYLFLSHSLSISLSFFLSFTSSLYLSLSLYLLRSQLQVIKALKAGAGEKMGLRWKMGSGWLSDLQTVAGHTLNKLYRFIFLVYPPFPFYLPLFTFFC